MSNRKSPSDLELELRATRDQLKRTVSMARTHVDIDGRKVTTPMRKLMRRVFDLAEDLYNVIDPLD